MKKRSSIYYAEYSKKREEKYRKDCEEILFKKNLQVIIDGNKVYLILDKSKTLLLNINQPKSVWFNIWLELEGI